MADAPAPAHDEPPTFPATPPERIELPSGQLLVRADPTRTPQAVAAINASLDHLRP